MSPKTKIFEMICLIVITGLFATSCASDPKSHDAEVSSAQSAPKVDQDHDEFTLLSEKSNVTWVGTKPTGRHRGIIPLASADIRAKHNQLIAANFKLDLSGLQINDLKPESDEYSKLHTHLMSPDFFDVTKFPEASFELIKAEPLHDPDQSEGKKTEEEFIVANANYKLTGNLTIKGITKAITFPVFLTIENYELEARAKFNINRTNWGITYNQESNFANKAKDGLIYDKVNVGFHIFARSENPI